MKDSTTQEEERPIGPDWLGRRTSKKIIIFPLRQFACVALQLLGESPAKPAGYVHGYDSLHIWSFEDRAYFPYGDWKRIEPRDE